MTKTPSERAAQSTVDAQIATIDAQIATIDRMLATLRTLTPAQRAELDRTLRAAHRLQMADEMTRRVLGK